MHYRVPELEGERQDFSEREKDNCPRFIYTPVLGEFMAGRTRLVEGLEKPSWKLRLVCRMDRDGRGEIPEAGIARMRRKGLNVLRNSETPGLPGVYTQVQMGLCNLKLKGQLGRLSARFP